MTVRLISHPSSLPSASPYRLVDARNRELVWANTFLDAQRMRQLSLRSLRAYGYDLLHLARWLQQTRHCLQHLTESLLINYVRCQLDHEPKPAASTINHRLGVRAVSIVSTTDGRFLGAGPTFSVPIPRARLWVTAALTITSLPACDCGSPAAWSFLFPPSRSPLFGKASIPFAISPSWP